MGLIDALLKEQTKEIQLAYLLLEARREKLWLKDYKDEEDFIKKKFPHHRSYYYRLIEIVSGLWFIPVEVLSSVGRKKAELLLKIQKKSGAFTCLAIQPWIDFAIKDDYKTFYNKVKLYMKKEDSKKTGKDAESIFRTFRFYGDQIITVELALDIMSKILGSDKSKSDALVMILANFLSQYSEDESGHVTGRNSYILTTIQGLIEQLDFTQPDTADLLIGVVGAGVENSRKIK